MRASAARTSIRIRQWPSGAALYGRCTRGQRSGAADADRDRQRGQHSRLHQEGQNGRGPADGLRPRSTSPTTRGPRSSSRQPTSVRGHGKTPLLDIALELERIALQDDYFVTRKLVPQRDFYSGLIYQAMGSRDDVPRCFSPSPGRAGWMSRSGRRCARPRSEDFARRSRCT